MTIEDNPAAPDEAPLAEASREEIASPAAPAAKSDSAVRKANQLALAALVIASFSLILSVLTLMARARMAIP